MYPQLTIELVANLELAAASGVRAWSDRLYVIADDELSLGVYDLRGAPCGRVPLLPGELPEEHTARKAHKPDFEALLSLPDGTLLALGSGSTPQRRRSVCISLGESPRAQVLDFSELYCALERELPELNLEGGAVWGERVWLCSRGNSARRDDALIELDQAGFCEAIAAGRAPTADVLRVVRRVQLGELYGAPLSLTDLSVWRGKLLFSAAAEASENTYDDGAVTGSIVGVMSLLGLAQAPEQVPGLKIEGICAADENTLFLVADADDRGSRAPLFRARPRL
ncbi:MAG TPA: hypothetical protein VJV78_23910 [Polyangiales bacterium]|nr:hypothetical protein [Polyangiales bacterium]